MTTSISQTSEVKDGLKTTEYVGYALGDTASNFFFQTFAMFLTIYYTDVWGIAPAVLVWLLPLVRLVGTFDDPIIGLIADRTRSRWGKFRPYLFWGAIPYGICGYLMFAGPDLGPNAKLVYAGVTYALMLTSYSIVNVPYSALLGVISPSSRTRAVASSFRFVGAFGGALLISFLVQPLVSCLGTSTLTAGDLRDLPSLAAKLKHPSRPFDIWLASGLTSASQEALSNYQEQSSEPRLLQQALVEDFNRTVHGNSIYGQERFAGIELRKETQTLMAQNPQERDLERLNRLLIEDAYPVEVSKHEMRGWRLTMAIFAVASVVLFWITFATTKERVAPPPQQKTNVREELGELFRNWPAVMILISSLLATTYFCLRGGCAVYYYKYVVGGDDTPILRLFSLDLSRSTVFLTTGSLSLMLGTALIGRFVRKIDKKYYACAFSAIAGLSFASFFILPKDWFGLQLAINAVSQLCAGPVAAITWALYGDVADYGEWKYGRRSTALVYSASLFAIKTGVVIAGFLLPLFLELFGFKANEEQTNTAKLGIILAFSLAPGLCGLLNAVALLVFPLDQKRVDEIERNLAARRVAFQVTP